ncbi:hypothetical protein Dimus_018454 [Dionaea muscipula]
MAISAIMNLNDDNSTAGGNDTNSANDDDHHHHFHQLQQQLQLLHHHHHQEQEHPHPPPQSEQQLDDDDDHKHDMVMPGFRFHPTEEELVEFYLRRKVEGKKFNVELITFLDLYRYDPWELPALAAIGEKEWFFYVPRDKKYRNGDRPNRVTTSGYWKATGADRMIRTENFRPIGLKKTLVFYSGKAPKGIRTSWIMNEYRLPQQETERYQKVEISLCRVYKRAGVEDYPSMSPRGLLSSKASSRATITAVNVASSSARKKQVMDPHPHHHQLEKMSTTSTGGGAEADASSGSTEVGTALGLSHNNTISNDSSSNNLMEIDKMIMLNASSGHPNLKPGVAEAAAALGGGETSGGGDHHSTTAASCSPLMGNCSPMFMGGSSSCSSPTSNPGLHDDLHRLVTYQQACMMNQQQQNQQQQQQFHAGMSHASSHPSPLFSSLLSQSAPLGFGLNAAAMAAAAGAGSSLASLTAGFPDRLWDWNPLPEHGREFNSQFK